jgi:predicted nucleic acid-binding protein
VIARSFVDTNVFVYVHDHADRRHARAREILAQVGAAAIVVSPQVMGEFYVTVTRNLRPPMTHPDALRAVHDLGRLTVVPLDDGLVRAAVMRSQHSTISYWDAMIVEAARAGGCRQLLTEDLAAGTDFDGVKVVNPFE